jgi:hypothetical protein
VTNVLFCYGGTAVKWGHTVTNVLLRRTGGDPPAVNMTLVWPKFSKKAGKRKATSPNLPAFHCIQATARDGALLRSILVTEGTTRSGPNDVRLAQVLEESWQAQSLHAARDDWCRLRHALPFLVVVRAIRFVLLQHESDVLVRSIAFHLSETHGANKGAAGANDALKLGVGESCVAALSLMACDCTIADTQTPKRCTSWPYRP